MLILTFLKNQKTHLIYIATILTIAAIAYHFLASKPKEVIKTVVQTKLIDRNIVQTKTQYIDRVIVKKDLNGTVTTTTETERDANSLVDKTKEADKFISKTVITNMSKYTLGVLYPIPLSLSSAILPTFNPLDLQLVGGIRVFSLPLFLNLGTNVRLNQAIVGITLEF